MLVGSFFETCDRFICRLLSKSQMVYDSFSLASIVTNLCTFTLVERNMTCKFWIEPIVQAKNYGFSAKELNKIRKIIQSNIDIIREAWHEHCG